MTAAQTWRAAARYDVAAIRHALTDPAHVAEALGLERSRTERSKWRCPRHGGMALSLRVGADGTLQCRCFGCDFAGDVLALIAEREGPDAKFAQVVERAADLAGIGPSAAPIIGRTYTPKPKALAYPPLDEVEALLDACTTMLPGADLASCYQDEDLRRYLAGRAIDPEDAWRRGLVYHLPMDARVPSWAVCGQPWTQSGHRLLCPLFDRRGALRSVRAWRPGSTAPKRVAPKGFTTAGLVLADLWGQAMLQGQGDHMHVAIVEGEPDFLTLATGGRLLDERPAILGVASGSWTDELAARIPDGAELRIATDPDHAGDAYAKTIAATLATRCRVLRVRLHTDINDAAMEAANE
jgi:hypothetical protein